MWEADHEELDKRFDELMDKHLSEGLTPEEHEEWEDVTFFAQHHPRNIKK